MSIIAGKYGGVEIKAPKGKITHPMSGRMRAALFSMLGDLEGLSVLDAFGGSGAIGLEAASRGANPVVIAENNSKAQRTIKQNIESLGADDVQLIQANVFTWLKGRGHRFDVIVADPPYARAELVDYELLSRYLADSGLLVISHPADLKPDITLKLVDRREYAGGNLSFHRN